MLINITERAHAEVEKIFRVILPKSGLTVREEQIALCHSMLDSLLHNTISLCDAGVGISGKISEDQRGFNVGELGFQLMNNLGSHKVKSPVTTQEKDVRALSNKIANNFSQPAFYLNRVFKCPMSAECYGHTASPLYSDYIHYIEPRQAPYNIGNGVMRCRFPFDQCGSLWNKRRSPFIAWQMKGSTLRHYSVFGMISR